MIGGETAGSIAGRQAGMKDWDLQIVEMQNLPGGLFAFRKGRGYPLEGRIYRRNVTSPESHSGNIRRGLETRMDKKILFREMSFAGCN